MEPDSHDEEMPRPSGVTFGLDPERVIAKLQARAAQMIQNLQWELATRDALVEVMEQRLNEAEQLRAEAEGALEDARDEMFKARLVAKELAERDAFLEASDDTVEMKVRP